MTPHCYFEFDVCQPRYRLDIFAMVPKKAMLEKLNQKVMLSEKVLLLSRLHEHNLSNETVSDANIAAINYIKKKTQILQQSIILRNVPNKYSQKFDYD